MWARDFELVKAVADELEKRFRPKERKDYDDYEPPEPPFKPEKPKKGETWLETRQRHIRDDVRRGRAVTMNQIARDAPKARVPRSPWSERLRSNGIWNWWR